MHPVITCLKITLLLLLYAVPAKTQEQNLVARAKQTMLNATRYMVENVSTQGGYLWYYLPRFSRRW